MTDYQDFIRSFERVVQACWKIGKAHPRYIVYQQRWNDEKTALIIECFDWNDDCLEPNDSFTKLIQTYGTIQSISPSGEWALLAKPSSPTASWPMALVNMDTLEIRCTSSLPGTVFSTPLSCFQWTSDESTFTFVDDDHEADDLPFEIHQSWVSGLSFNRGCIYRFDPSAPSHPLLFRGSYCYGPHVVVDDSICFCIAREQTPFHDPLNATTTLPTRLLRVNLRTGESSDVPLPILRHSKQTHQLILLGPPTDIRTHNAAMCIASLSLPSLQYSLLVGQIEHSLDGFCGIYNPGVKSDPFSSDGRYPRDSLKPPLTTDRCLLTRSAGIYESSIRSISSIPAFPRSVPLKAPAANICANEMGFQ
ncbi:hypothetical protein WA588_005397 [Blastocystis sp. NMH]